MYSLIVCVCSSKSSTSIWRGPQPRKSWTHALNKWMLFPSRRKHNAGFLSCWENSGLEKESILRTNQLQSSSDWGSSLNTLIWTVAARKRPQALGNSREAPLSSTVFVRSSVDLTFDCNSDCWRKMGLLLFKPESCQQIRQFKGCKTSLKQLFTLMSNIWLFLASCSAPCLMRCLHWLNCRVWYLLNRLVCGLSPSHTSAIPPVWLPTNPTPFFHLWTQHLRNILKEFGTNVNLDWISDLISK